MIIIPIRIGLRNLQPGLNLLETTKKKKPVKFGYLDSTKTTMDERIGSDVSHFRERERPKKNKLVLSFPSPNHLSLGSFISYAPVNILQSLRTQDEFKTKIRGSVDRLLRKKCSHSRNVGKYLIPFLFVISIIISLS